MVTYNRVFCASGRHLREQAGGPALGPPAEATEQVYKQRVREFFNSVMIPPLVHQRRPCYDFYFL